MAEREFLTMIAAPGQSHEEALKVLLARHGGDVAAAARSTGYTRKCVWDWIRKFDLYAFLASERERCASTYDVPTGIERSA